MAKLMPTCISLDPSVRSYLEEIVKDPTSLEFKQTYSSIVNVAVAQHAEVNGRTIHLEPVKKRGRPKRVVE